jgi:hypothetical protein
MSKKYYTSRGWKIDLRKLHPDDRLFIQECEDDNDRQIFIDECEELYRTAWGRDIIAFNQGRYHRI